MPHAASSVGLVAGGPIGYAAATALLLTLLFGPGVIRRLREIKPERLHRWLSRVDLAPPYEFFLELLGENGQAMRKRMLTRLGPEAAESLDEFLDLALGFDRESPPSLQGFVNAMRSTDVEIKRDMEQKRDEVLAVINEP